MSKSYRLPQPASVTKALKEQFSHLMINDDLGFTGEFRMSSKEVIDLMIVLQDEDSLDSWNITD